MEGVRIMPQFAFLSLEDTNARADSTLAKHAYALALYGNLADD
jgi:hypothetical protein